ncbi:MAG: hypothetical protein ACKVOR_05405 [Flavobacteriales bacterium]
MQEANIIQFDKYATEQLNAEEKHALESRIEADLTFQNEWKEYQTLRKIVTAAKAHELKQQLQNIRAEETFATKQTRVIKLNKGGWLAIAASLVLISAMVLWYIGRPAADGMALYASYHTTYPAPSTVRDAAADEQWKSFNTAYNNGDYARACLILRQADSTVYHAAAYTFYIAICEIEKTDGNKADAEKRLAWLINANNKYSDAGRWYLSLLMIKEQRMSDAKPHLYHLKEQGLYKHKEAAELLDLSEAFPQKK